MTSTRHKKCVLCTAYMKTGPTRTEKKILKAALSGKDEGWTLFFKTYEPLIRDVAAWSKWRLTPELIDEAVHLIHIALMKAIPKYKGDSTLQRYVKQIAIYVTCDEMRRQMRRNKNKKEFILDVKTMTSFDDTVQFQDPHNDAMMKEEYQLIVDAMDQVGETCGISLRMRYVDHLSYNEIAEKLGIALNTVCSRLSKCRNQIKEILLRNPTFERMAK